MPEKMGDVGSTPLFSKNRRRHSDFAGRARPLSPPLATALPHPLNTAVATAVWVYASDIQS